MDVIPVLIAILVLYFVFSSCFSFWSWILFLGVRYFASLVLWHCWLGVRRACSL